MEVRFTRGKSAILERSLTRPKTEVSVSAFALLFSEMVQYCQSRVYSVSELQARLADMGQGVGASLLDVLVMREKNGKRETKVLNILLFIKVLLFICLQVVDHFWFDVMLHFSKSVLMKKQAYLHLGWPEGE
uniref:Trafficking protein particle complex 5 n=1 Tax=Sinocyclocheilus grahami TaxID=75366 RepID=A0A672NQF8_SINGR